jgi:hypothetical protein
MVLSIRSDLLENHVSWDFYMILFLRFLKFFNLVISYIYAKFE